MDDLVGLDWTASSSSSASKPPPMSNGNYYLALRPTPPISGRSTPALQNALSSSTKPATCPNIPSKSSTPANDSFANLLPFNATQSTKCLSLQDQQKLLQKQRDKETQDRQKQFDTHFGSTGNAPWPGLSNGRATPGRVVSAPKYTGTNEYGGHKLSTAINKPFAAISGAAAMSFSKKLAEDLDNLLAAFDADTPVDSSSNMPPISPALASHNVASRDISRGRHEVSNDRVRENGSHIRDPDDDPFGLGTSMPNKPETPLSSAAAEDDDDDDDVLGLLGRPVSELPPPQSYRSDPLSAAPTYNTEPADRAVAELVDMGFPAGRAKIALEATESGSDVQAAVGWLLSQAHEESRSRSTVREVGRRNSTDNREGAARNKPRNSSNIDADAPVPAWMRQQSRSSSTQRREDSRSPANGERDPAKVAAEIGSTLFKTANSLWKTGAKKLNQAVSEFNSDSDSSQPKWMRESRNECQDIRNSGQTRRSHDDDEDENRPQKATARSPSTKVTPSITDEALMLESGDARPRPRQKPQPARTEARPTYSTDSSRDQSPVVSARNFLPTQPKFMQQPSTHPRSKLSRQAIEDESAQAYVSSARRKKNIPKPPSPEPDLLVGASLPTRPAQSKSAPSFQPQAKPQTLVPTRPPFPVRKVPPLSGIALRSSTSHRQTGTNAFKLGNYAQATTSYTSSLSDLPPSHPLTIVLLTNRALSNLKTGDPKACISDADAAITTIGPSKGQGETIDIGGDEGTKPMSIYWGKAMTRKAEALEQLERWADAAKAWKECVEGGVGGSTSIQGRDRCEKAAAGPSAPSAPPSRPKPTTRKPPHRSAARPTLTTAASAEAVTRLRAANAAAERADEEKFGLADSVDERLTSWRKGKEGNLRALLASLDQVLWEGAGWRKVGMGELIVPGKVKVAYMRGIGKVHPDKVSAGRGGEQGEGRGWERDLLTWVCNLVTAECYDGASYD